MATELSSGEPRSHICFGPSHAGVSLKHPQVSLLRVLHYGLSLGPPWVEGLRNTVRSLSRRLVERGFEVSVLSTRLSGNSHIEGVEYIGLGVGGEAYSENAPQALLAVSRWLRHNSARFDVVHGHSSFTLPSVLGVFSDAQNFFTLYSPAGASGRFVGYGGELSGALLRFAKSSLPLFVSWKTRLVAISQGVRQSLPAPFASRCRIIPVGVDFDRFNRCRGGIEVRAQLGLEDARVVLFAGDVTPWKGGEDFLMAAALVLRSTKENVRFLFLTKGTYEYEAERLGRLRLLAQTLGVSDRLIFLGRRSDIEAVYQASDVVVLPYRSVFTFMSTPLSLLEAMSAARPVVASRVGDMATIIRDGENGLLFEPGNTKQLATKILWLLHNPQQAQKMGEAASRQAKTHDWSTIAERYAKLYTELEK